METSLLYQRRGQRASLSIQPVLLAEEKCVLHSVAEAEEHGVLANMQRTNHPPLPDKALPSILLLYIYSQRFAHCIYYLS